MLKDEFKKLLEKQQYRFAGEHSAVKICTWTKKSILGKGECYKAKFYGIKSHLCCQMTPTLTCTNMCVFCWRDQSNPSVAEWNEEKLDDPKEIIKKCIEQQRKLLVGFFGLDKADKKKLKEAENPKHFAISLAGEPTLYPKLPEMVKEIHKQGMSTFVVTNGLFPEVLKKINPTQLYISVDAPNKELFYKIDKPCIKDAWERFNKSLEVISAKKCRTAVRITLVLGMNDCDIEGYAELIKKADPDFVEVKGYMFVGSSRQRLEMKNMPFHEQVVEFSKELEKKLDGWKIVNEQAESRVVLLAKNKDTLIDWEKLKKIEI
jgi:tRNA wybutosine-synthesizing protein 1